jgi:hypothetical protein
MSTQKMLRETRRMIEDMGMTVERIIEGKHLKLHLDTPSGKHILVIPRSTSDNARGEKNTLARLRQWCNPTEENSK